MAEKNQAKAEEQKPRIEVGDTPSEEGDFFEYPSKDPNFHYHWAENNPRKIQMLKRLGYEIDPCATSKESNEKVKHQIDFLKKKISSLDASPSDAKAAKELLSQIENSNIDTTVNIPQHVMMRTTEEIWKKRQAKKMQRSASHEAQIQQNIEDLSKALKRSGAGGMKAFKDLFDRISK